MTVFRFFCPAVLSLTLLVGLLTPSAAAQDGDVLERLTVPFSNPSRPGTVVIDGQQLTLHIEAYDGTEAIVETRSGNDDHKRDHDWDWEWDDDADDREQDRRQGLRRLTQNNRGLLIEEEDNVMRVSTGWGAMGMTLRLRVPRRTNLRLETMNGGTLRVQGVQGTHEISNMNGDILLEDIAGSAVVSSLNGDIEAVFTRTDDTPMSFSTMNGDIDVTFPTTLRADLVLQTERGEIYTDFDITLDRDRRVETDGERRDGVYTVRIDNTLYGTVGGGGPELRFKTFNADIFLRKGE